MTALMITSLTGCGNSYDIGYSKGMMNSSDSFTSVASEDAYYGYNEDYDYNGTSIKGQYVDYSYDISARGLVSEKEDVLSFYEDLSDFVDDNGGYIENVNNTYTDNYIEPDDSYISNSDVKYSATGTVRFTVQIEEEHSNEIIELFDKFCEKYDMTITGYNQYIQNYDYYDVREEDDDYSWRMTQKQLEKEVEFTDIDVCINYMIARPSGEQSMLKVRRFFTNLWDGVSDMVTAIFWICVWVYVALFVVLLPVIKIIKKSIYKYNKKHPEYASVKSIKIVDNSVETVDNNVKG